MSCERARIFSILHDPINPDVDSILSRVFFLHSYTIRNQHISLKKRQNFALFYEKDP